LPDETELRIETEIFRRLENVDAPQPGSAPAVNEKYAPSTSSFSVPPFRAWI